MCSRIHILSHRRRELLRATMAPSHERTSRWATRSRIRLRSCISMLVGRSLRSNRRAIRLRSRHRRTQSRSHGRAVFRRATRPRSGLRQPIVHCSSRRGGLDDPRSPGNSALGAVRKCGSGRSLGRDRQVSTVRGCVGLLATAIFVLQDLVVSAGGAIFARKIVVRGEDNGSEWGLVRAGSVLWCRAQRRGRGSDVPGPSRVAAHEDWGEAVKS